MPVPLGRWRKVQDLIEFFVLNGCVLGELSGHSEGPSDDDPIRYLFSPLTEDFVSLSNLDNDDRVPPSVYENWERRLGFALPEV